MTRLLLDHPWPLHAVFDGKSDGFGVLLGFLNLTNKTGLLPVRFVEKHEYEAEMQKINSNRNHRSLAGLKRLLQQCKRTSESIATATPTHPPSPVLDLTWKRALREELERTISWRTPQIVIPEKRRNVWPVDAHEVEIHIDDQPGSITKYRLLVPLEWPDYDTHPFAVPDLDPWRHLEWLHRPNSGTRDEGKPCRLPIPPVFKDALLDQIADRLPEAIRQGWKVNDGYFFIPPDTFRPEQVEKQAWRTGKAFPKDRAANGRGPGPIDYMGRVWVWDHNERHWDVQLLNGKYKRVNHDGLDLG